MANTRKAIQDTILTYLQAQIPQVVTWDKKLQDVPIEELPYCVVFVRQKSRAAGEIGTVQDLWSYEVNIYLLDITETQDFNHGEDRRDDIMDAMTLALEEYFNLGGLSVQLANGHSETVYDTTITSVLFDSSGQDGYYTFTSELYLTVDTQRN